MGTVKIWQGDITRLKVDVIVNAANSSLLGGGGVDGAIHRAAGPELLEECMALHGCRTGEAKITLGYKLPAKHVIHTVGPVWHGGGSNEERLLKSCYENSLALVLQNGLKSVAFPSIGTGIYGFPIDKASKIALETVSQFASNHDVDVTLVCFSNSDFDIYTRTASQMGIELAR